MDETLRFEDGRVWISTINFEGYTFDPRLLGDFSALLTALALAALVGLLATEPRSQSDRRSPAGAAALLLMTSATMLLMATFMAYGSTSVPDATALFAIYSSLLHVLSPALLIAFLALVHLAATRPGSESFSGGFGMVFQALYFAYAVYWGSQAAYFAVQASQTAMPITWLLAILPVVLAALYLAGPGLRWVLRRAGRRIGASEALLKWLCILAAGYASVDFALHHYGQVYINFLLGVDRFRDAGVAAQIVRGPLPAFVLLALIQHAMPDLRSQAERRAASA